MCFRESRRRTSPWNGDSKAPGPERATMKSTTSKKRSGDNPQPHETMRKTYLALAAAGLILASCQKDNEPSAQLPPTAPQSAMTLLGTIDASAPEPARTSTKKPEGGGIRASVKWDLYDAVALYMTGCLRPAGAGTRRQRRTRSATLHPVRHARILRGQKRRIG